MDEAGPVEMIQAMLRAVQGLKLYPAQHPNLQRQVNDWLLCLERMLHGRPQVVLGAHQQTLFCDDRLFTEPLAAAENLLAVLSGRMIASIVFTPGVSARELADFLVLLTGPGSPEQLLEGCRRAGLRHIEARLVEDEEERDSAQAADKVYQQAIDVTDSIFNDVRMGKIPQSGAAIAAVRAMVETTLTEPHALLALSLIKDYDDYTFRHSVNVAVIALAVGRASGLDETRLRVLGFGALLHDLGKLRIDIAIINKPGRLTSREFERIKDHPLEGAEILRQMEDVPSAAIAIALGHHLGYDRSGYPASVRSVPMPDYVHMVAIADAYDAMTTLRPYQQAMTPRGAMARLRESAGSLYHPQLLENFAADLGSYPVGSLVRLNSNQIGLVSRVGFAEDESVRLKILLDADGRELASPESLDLVGADMQRIVGEVNPLSRGIQVADYLP
ncbi:HD-GYP domain-containing protein [Geothermobacter hydrogeniphilus]|nr:HD-GYP domain-containing protein [Geothermobacter hydrogeniphilus]